MAVTIDPPIALLKTQKRPWQVEMNEAMALEMQVKAFRGHVGSDQDPDRRALLAKLFDDLLGPNIRLDTTPIYARHLVRRKFQILAQPFRKPRDSCDPLREDHQTISGRFPCPAQFAQE